MDPSGARGVGTADTNASGPRLRIKAASCMSLPVSCRGLYPGSQFRRETYEQETRHSGSILHGNLSHARTTEPNVKSSEGGKGHVRNANAKCGCEMRMRYTKAKREKREDNHKIINQFTVGKEQRFTPQLAQDLKLYLFLLISHMQAKCLSQAGPECIPLPRLIQSVVLDWSTARDYGDYQSCQDGIGL